MTQPIIEGFFDERTNTVSYVVWDPATKKAAIIDSVLDYDPASGRIWYESADKLISYINAQDLSVDWILETHVHADHLTASAYLKETLGGQVAIGKEITTVQAVFGEAFNEGPAFARDGSQFDMLWSHGDTFMIGEIEAKVLHVPGHTPADVAYIVGDSVFAGDTIFMPDFGSARCDFPGGSSKTLYQSVRQIFNLPDETRMFLCHDYLPEGRDSFSWETTVGEQRSHNIHLKHDISEGSFCEMRDARDMLLGMPKLIIPALQVNMRAGHFPKPDLNGISYLRIPINGVFAKETT